MSKGKLHPCGFAREVAESLIEQAPPGVRMLIAGSLRRQKTFVHDIDIVAIVADETAQKRLDDWLANRFGRQANGKPARRGEIRGMAVDIYIATPEDVGAQLLTWTGSAEYNIRMRAKAKRKGFKLNQYGLWRGDERVAGRTEAEIFEALGLEFKPPEKR